MSHFYGSNLWNLFDIDNIYIAWNKVIRIVFNLPYRTHRYLLEPYSGFTHLFSLLTNRFLKFYETLFYWDKNVIRNLRIIQENDCRSTFGINIRNICMRNNTENILIAENSEWNISQLTIMICGGLTIWKNYLKAKIL